MASKTETISASLPKVWLEFGDEKQSIGRVIIILRADVCPKTSENFRALCVGDFGLAMDKSTKLHYTGTKIHRIIPSLGVFGGDIHGRGGLGGETVFASESLENGAMIDENFAFRHTGRGVVSMVGANGPDSAGSCFMIQLRKGAIPEFDGRMVAFGFVVGGWETLGRLEARGDMDGFPKGEISIVRSGQVLGDGTAQSGATLQLRRASQALGIPQKEAEEEEVEDEKGDAATVVSKVSSATSSKKREELAEQKRRKKRVLKEDGRGAFSPGRRTGGIPVTQVVAAMRLNPQTALGRAYQQMGTTGELTRQPSSPIIAKPQQPSPPSGTRADRVSISHAAGIESDETREPFQASDTLAGSKGIVTQSFQARSSEGAVAVSRLGGGGSTLHALARRVRGAHRSSGDPRRTQVRAIGNERRQRIRAAVLSGTMAAAGVSALSRLQNTEEDD